MARHYAGPYRHACAEIYHTDDECPVGNLLPPSEWERGPGGLPECGWCVHADSERRARHAQRPTYKWRR